MAKLKIKITQEHFELISHLKGMFEYNTELIQELCSGER